MPISLSNFKDLLEAYFLIKNAPERGEKKRRIRRYINGNL